MVSSSTASATTRATLACAASSTTRTSGRIRSWLITPAWEIGSRPWT